MLNRRAWLVSLAALGLGVVAGRAAVHLWRTGGRVVGDATRLPLASRAVVFGEPAFDGNDILTRAVPAGSKVVVGAGGARA